MAWKLLFLLIAVFYLVNFTNAAVHFQLFRRSGRFARHDFANLTNLKQTLDIFEYRYTETYRKVEGNRLVRKWRMSTNDNVNAGDIPHSTGHEGHWYTTLRVGEPAQSLQFDLDMLSSDIYALMTTSGKGSKYDTFASHSHSPSNELVHPTCRKSSEIFDFGGTSHRIDFPVCNPSKSSLRTLSSSGSSLGLGPCNSLARLSSASFGNQLRDKNIIDQQLWSTALIDADKGILTFGGTIAKEVETVKFRTRLELDHFGKAEATPDWITKQVEAQLQLSMPEDRTYEEHFKWINVQGSSGWWTALMSGVWVSGAKILKNQPILLDIQSPFILMPPFAARRFYEAIPGSKRMSPPYDNFFAFPCLNRVHIAFELGGWNFPVVSGEGTRKDAILGPPGGWLSLGKLGNGTGYCVGIVAGTRMGAREDNRDSGVQDLWVLGEPFFRGHGIVFDPTKNRIGVRGY